MTQRNIVDHAKTLAQAARMSPVCSCLHSSFDRYSDSGCQLSDVIDGLCYLHSLDIVHGDLNPVCSLVDPC
jgi:serine/threonine protein kinase